MCNSLSYFYIPSARFLGARVTTVSFPDVKKRKGRKKKTRTESIVTCVLWLRFNAVLLLKVSARIYFETRLWSCGPVFCQKVNGYCKRYFVFKGVTIVQSESIVCDTEIETLTAFCLYSQGLWFFRQIQIVDGRVIEK